MIKSLRSKVYNSRRFTYRTMPIWLRKEIDNIIPIVLTQFPFIEKLYLCGSYAEGNYYDTLTSPELLKYLDRSKDSHSDIDLCSPEVDKHYYVQYSNKIDLLPMNYSIHPILIYNKHKQNE